jgi:hypothetical protein
MNRRLATNSSQPRSRVWSHSKTVSSQGASEFSAQTSRTEVRLTSVRVTTGQMSPGSRGEPSIPGKGSSPITSAATSLTSHAERDPSGWGSSNTFTQPDIFSNQTDALAPPLNSIGNYRRYHLLPTIDSTRPDLAKIISQYCTAPEISTKKPSTVSEMVLCEFISGRNHWDRGDRWDGNPWPT